MLVLSFTMNEGMSEAGRKILYILAERKSEGEKDSEIDHVLPDGMTKNEPGIETISSTEWELERLFILKSLTFWQKPP